MSLPKCPICRTREAPRAGNQHFPFCSARCKDIDLGDWLGGQYVIASPGLDLNFPLPTEEDDQSD